MDDVTSDDVGATISVGRLGDASSASSAAGPDAPADQQVVLEPVEQFDVFLSYSRRDERVVHRIARALLREGLQPWLDAWQTVGGVHWQQDLADGLRRSRACAIFIGPGASAPDGTGPPGLSDWAREEVMVAVNRAATDPTFRVFPVLLEGVPEGFDAAALHPFLAMRTWVDLRGGLAHEQALQPLLNAIHGVPSDRPRVPSRVDECPYKGLRVFEESDAKFFFGRDAERQRIVEKLKTSPFVAVLGPSGSGKSSLVRAGVLPHVRSGHVPGGERWTLLTLTPGSRPLDTLASYLAPLAPDLTRGALRDQLADDERTLRLLAAGLPRDQRLLLVVDQFEEVFTLCSSSEERRRTIENLLEATAGAGSCTVLLTMRADFYPRVAELPQLAQRVSSQQFLVGPMDRENLRQVIEAPAHLVGLSFESGLVDVILDDVGVDAGSLPLLEHALYELWERRLGDLMTLKGYRDAGGVAGALAQRADTTWNELDPESQHALRRIMLRLTRPGEGSEDTKQRAYFDELVPSDEQEGIVDEVVLKLADARLLVRSVDLRTERMLVDVAHEALIRGWPRLRTWVEENREGLQIHQRLTQGAREWEELGREEDALYRGARLAAAREWASTADDQLNDLERAFLEASIAAEHQEIEEERQRARQERERAEKEARSARRLRVLALGLGVLLIAAVAASAVAVVSFNRANEQSRLATRRAEESAAETLAERAVNLAASDPQQALLLALEAYELAATPAVRAGLLQTAIATWRVDAILDGHDGSVFTAEPSSVLHAWQADRLVPQEGGPVHLVASSGDDQAVRLWDAATRSPIGEPLMGHGARVWTVTISPDGRVLASGDADGRIMLWDVATQQPLETSLAGHGDAVYTLRFHPERSDVLASASADGTFRIWDVSTGAVVASRDANAAARPDGALDTEVRGVVHLAFSQDAELLATAGADGSIQLWEVAGWGAIAPPTPAHEQVVTDLEFAQDGASLISSSEDGQVHFWRVDDRELVHRATRSDHPGAVFAVGTSRDGELAATAGADGGVIVWDVDTATPIREELRGHSRNVFSLTFDRERRLLTAGADGGIVRWDVTSDVPPPFGRTLAGHRLAATDDVLVVAGPDGDLSWRDPSSAREIAAASRDGHGSITALAARGLLSDGNGQSDPPALVAAGSSDGHVEIWEGRRLVGRSDDLGAALSDVTFSPVAPLVVAAEQRTGLITVSDLDGRSMTRFRHSPGVQDLAISPDGRLLAAAGGDHRVRLFDLREHASLGTVPSEDLSAGRRVGHTAWVYGVAFSPDGQLLATASQDSTIALWDVATRAPAVQPLQSDAERLTAVAFAPDGRTLAATTDVGAVELWDLGDRRSPQRLGTLSDAHGAWSWSVGFTGDGRLLSAADNSSAVVWSDLVTARGLDAWQQHVCRVVASPLSADEWALHLDGPYDPSCSEELDGPPGRGDRP